MSTTANFPPPDHVAGRWVDAIIALEGGAEMRVKVFAEFPGRIDINGNPTASVPRPRISTPISTAAEYERWLDGIADLEEGARLRRVSIDTLKREAKKGRVKLLQISEGRFGVRRRDALLMLEPKRRRGGSAQD